MHFISNKLRTSIILLWNELVLLLYTGTNKNVSLSSWQVEMFSLSPPIHANGAMCLSEPRDEHGWELAVQAWSLAPCSQPARTGASAMDHLKERTGLIFNGHSYFTLTLFPVSVLEEVFKRKRWRQVTLGIKLYNIVQNFAKKILNLISKQSCFYYFPGLFSAL